MDSDSWQTSHIEYTQKRQNKTRLPIHIFGICAQNSQVPVKNNIKTILLK